jgi:hypothetical protein
MAFDYSGWSSELTKAPRLQLGWLVFFLLGFAVLAAPVNLYLIAPRNKRHRLFVSVPMLSLGAVGALVGFILFNEGAGGTGMRNALLMLEPGAGNSILYQEQLSRTGMVAQSGFPFPEDAVFMWVPGEGRTNHNVALLRQGNTAAGGWFVARAVQSHILQRWIPSRAEVVLRQSPGAAPALVSSVNHVMGPVFYVDEAKHYWKAGELAPGNPAVMEKATPEEFTAWYAGVFAEPSANLRARAKQVGARPGWFYAKAEAAPDFWIATSPQIRWVRDQMLCCGPVKAQVLNTVTEAQP